MDMIKEKWDVMVTYNWETDKKYADDLYKVLIDNGYEVWMNKDNILGDIGVETSKAIANSKIIVFLISEKYEQSHYCQSEYTLAYKDKKKIMPIRVEKYDPVEGSNLRLFIAKEQCYNLFEDKEENMTKIMMAIEKLIGKRIPKNFLNGIPGKIRNILEEAISLDWKKFARFTGYNDVDITIDSLENELDDVKKKMSCFLDKLYQFYPHNYMDLIEKSLRGLGRYDVIYKLGLDKRVALKKYYHENHKQMGKIRLLNLTVVNTEKFNDVDFEKEFHLKTKLFLISGITGIGKTSFIQMCLLNWANESLWSDIDLVFYLEFNQLICCHGDSIDKNVITQYSNVSKDWNNISNSSKLFVIDGLDGDLIDSSFIKELAKTLKNPNNKCIVAGRFRDIKLFKEKFKQEKESLEIASFQVTGFNDDEIKEYIQNIDNRKEKINDYLNAFHFAKSMTSVPFCLKRICEVISASSMDGKYSFNSMTEFYSNIFLYFLQTYVNKNNIPADAVMQFLSEICELAYCNFNEDKGSKKQNMTGFEEIYYKEFEALFGDKHANQSLLNLCASIHAYKHLSPKEIIGNENLRLCVSMICGIMNSKDKVKEGLGDYFQPIATGSNEERKNQLLCMICESLPKMALFGKNEDQEFFMECFYEAQATISDKMKRAMKRREWLLFISDESEPWKIIQKKYFFENFFAKKMKLKYLGVKKVRLSSDEMDLIKECSKNVSWVIFKSPVKIEGWTPGNNFKLLWIFIDSNITKTDFECFYPWIERCEMLRLSINKNVSFIKSICDTIKKYSNIRKLKVRYC